MTDWYTFQWACKVHVRLAWFKNNRIKYFLKKFNKEIWEIRGDRKQETREENNNNKKPNQQRTEKWTFFHRLLYLSLYSRSWLNNILSKYVLTQNTVIFLCKWDYHWDGFTHEVITVSVWYKSAVTVMSHVEWMHTGQSHSLWGHGSEWYFFGQWGTSGTSTARSTEGN